MSDVNNSSQNEKAAKVRRKPERESVLTPTFAVARQTTPDRHQSQPSGGSLLQRQCSCGKHTIGGGMCEECQQKGEAASPNALDEISPSPPPHIQTIRDTTVHFNLSHIPAQTRFTANGQPLQPTLTVNAPGDQYKQEADRVAETVMRMPASPPSAPSTEINNFVHPILSRLSAISRIQASGDNGAFQAPTSVEKHITQMQNDGQALTPEEQDFFTERMGYDFSSVRVHTDGNAVQASRDIQAKAFTVGNNIAFNEGAYQPGTDAGRRLLAHELTHVVQQKRASAIQRDYGGEEPTGRTDSNAIIPIENFIQYVEAVENGYPDDTLAEIVTRIRQLYYSGLNFDQLIPNAHTHDTYNMPVPVPIPFFSPLISPFVSPQTVPVSIRRGVSEDNVGEDAHRHLTARADENAQGDNPSPYILLQNGERIDIGHLLLSLDALIHPGAGEPFTSFEVPNIDPASWVADIGIAAVWMTQHEESGSKPTTAPRELTSPNIDEYYQMSAPTEDLLGDVDSFGAHHQMSSSQGQSLSQVLRNYYLGSSQENVNRRWQTFCDANGLAYTRTGSSITWRLDLRQPIIDRVNRFNDLYGAGEVGAAWGVIAGPTRREWPYTPTVVDKFLDFVKTNLESELQNG